MHYVGRVTVFRGRRPDCALVLCGANRAGQGMIAGERGVTEAASVGIDLARLRYEQGKAASAFLRKV